MYSILCVDDEPSLLEIIKLFLEKSKDFLVDVHTSAQDALSSSSLSSYDAIVADYQMPGMDGIAFLKAVREKHGDIPFILFTGKGREEIVIQAINNGADFYLQKGGDPVAQFAELTHKIRQAIAQRRTQQNLKAAYEHIAASEEELRGQYEALAGSEQRIRESEQNYRLLFETATEGILIAQGDRMVLVNPAMILLLGYPEEILTSKPFTDFIHPGDRELVLSRHLQRMRGETPPTGYTFRIVTSGGQEKWVLISSTLMTWFGKPASLSLLTDITEQKKAEESLLSANMEYTNLLDQIQDVYYRSDAEGRLVKASRSWATLLGYDDVSECIGKNIANDFYMNPADRKRFLEDVNRNGKVTDYEILLKKKDGTQVIVESNSHLYHDPAGNIIGIEGIFRDITERKRAEEALFNSRQMLQLVLDSIPQRVFWKDRNSVFLGCNKPLANDAGFSDPAEMVGKTDYDHASHSTADLYRADDRQVMETGQPKINYEEPQVRSDGGRAWLRTTKVPLRNKEGEIIGVLGTYEDITGQKKAEEELRTAYEKITASEEELRGQYDELAKSERLLREKEASIASIFRAAPIGIGVVSNRILLIVNDRLCEITGYSREELVGKSARMVYPSDEEYQFVGKETYEQIHKYGTGTVETLWQRKDGAIRNILLSSTPLDQENLAAGVTFTALDITDRRQTQDELMAACERISASEEELRGQYEALAESEQRIRESEERYRNFIKNASEGIFRIDFTRPILVDQSRDKIIKDVVEHAVIGEVNEALARMYGLRPEDMIGHPVREFNPDCGTQTADLLNTPGYRITGHEGTEIGQGGAPLYIVESYFGIVEGGYLKRGWGVQRDVTDRRIAEEALRESRERLQLALEAGNDGLFDWDMEKGTVYFSHRYFSMLGYGPDELPASFETWMDLLHPDDRDRALSVVQDYKMGIRSSHEIEFRLRARDGGWKWILSRAKITTRNSCGQPVRMVGTHTDITDRKKAETKLLSTCEQLSATEKELREQYNALALSEQRVRESETKFRAIIDHTFEFIGLMKPDGTVLEANESALEFAGISESDVLNRPFWETPWWAHSKKLQGELKEAIKKAATGETVRFEATHPAADGHLATVDFSIKPVRDSADRILYLIPEGRDITERKHVEEALLASEQKYRSLIETTGTGYVIIDDQGRVLDANSAYVRLTGNTEINEIAGRSVLEWTAPYDKEKNADAVRKCIAEGFIHNFEIDYSDASGTITPVEINATAIRSGDAVQILTLCRDISERRRTQQLLRESEETFRRVIEGAPEAIYIGTDWKFAYLNPAAVKLFGASSSEQLVGTPFIDLIHPRFHDIIRSRVHQLYYERAPVPLLEEVYLRLDGTEIDVEVSSVPFRFGGKNGALVFIRDITARKQAERDLRESEERFRRLVSGSFDAVVIHEGGRIVLVNDAAVQIVGAASTADLVGKPILDLVHPDLRAIVKERIDRLVQSPEGTAPLLEEKFIRLDGSFIDVEVMSTAMKHEGRPAVMVVFRDISGRKKVEEELRTAYINLSAAEQELRGQYEELAMNEEALRESEEKFRALVETTSDFIWEVDEHGTYTYVSPQMKDLLGYEPSEILGKTSFDLMPPDEAQRVGAEFSRIVESRLPIVVLENKNFRKDGTIVVLETSGVPRFTDDGRFIGYRGIDRDVTDRNRVEEALKESEERLSSILRGTPVLQFVIDSNHKIISWNKALEEYSGIAAAEILGTDQQWRAFYPEKRPVLADLLVDGRIDLIPELYAGKFSKSGLVKGAYDAIDFFPHMGESGIWLHFTAAPVVDAKGTVIGAVETLEDITKRRMAEEALQKSEKKYRHVLENMQDAYFRADRDGNLTMVNPSAVRMYGFGSADEMIGIPAASLYDNPEQREDMLRELKEKGIVTDLTGKGRRKDGSTFWASMNAQFIIDDDGRILGTEGIVRDISERRTMENAIHEVNRKLNLLNSITRHDVANQLIALRGYTQIAMIRKPEPVISDLLTKIDAAAETIASQIEFTKVYQEMGLKDPAWFRIEDVVSKAGYQQVKFSNTCRSNEIFADPMLERIFLNLFDNSIRHGEKVTEITVRCERAPGGLLIIVEDDGVGIPLEEKEKIFEKGFGKHTGFGLFLAKEVLSLTGITIRETGVFQQGSRFEILVPKGLYRIVPQTIRPDQG